MTGQDHSLAMLERIAHALERLAPPAASPVDLHDSNAFVWEGGAKALRAAQRLQFVKLDLLKGIDQQRDILLANTRQFGAGAPANNALLWGARGMGKSSLIKAVHAAVNNEMPNSLALLEIHREDIDDLPLVLRQLSDTDRRFLIFCDDLSFDGSDASYKSLKTALEGGIEGRPDNVLFYATSNRRHLLPREMIENEKSTAIHAAEPAEEKISLSDRFGLWLGFYSVGLEMYLSMVDAYADYFSLKISPEDLHQQAFQWATARGGRSGRVAWQFIQDLRGRIVIDNK